MVFKSSVPICEILLVFKVLSLFVKYFWFLKVLSLLQGMPAELQEYLNTIQKQRLKFEEELEECDALMDRTIADAKGEGSTGHQYRCVSWTDWWGRWVVGIGQWGRCVVSEQVSRVVVLYEKVSSVHVCLDSEVG